MTENLIIENNLTLAEQYKALNKQLRALLNNSENLLSNLSNFTAALKQTFGKISWVGFYIFDGEKLYLGPFQGKVACTIIQIGKGVCGTSAEKLKTIVVPDVNVFPGHIACDTDSKSEIVIPILKENKLWGVLDLDSASTNSFNEIDRLYLENFCKFLSEEIIR
ncbi:MAG: GAF domain-containing protein [Ignavibacteriaceae bacterium]|nr:GAF domain-containing protein [Ignavibacteriaceae bacterium]